MSQKIVRRIAPGIYELESGGFRVRVAVGDWKRGGQQRDTTFPAGTALRKMKDWQTDKRAMLKRQRFVPATGTLEADIPRYLESLEHQPRLASDRKYELEAWVESFGARRRHMLTRPEVEQQVKAWARSGVAASTVRHRMTALSQLYRELDGDSDSNPVKGVQRPSEPDAEPEARPVNMIQSVLDKLWYRTAMNNRGWPTLSRALVLAHTGMRPAQVKRSQAALTPPTCSDGGTEPVWNRNGRELFYRSGNKMMAVQVTTQPGFSAGKPTMLFEKEYAGHCQVAGTHPKLVRIMSCP